MRESVLNWLKLHEDEVVVFLWAAALLFLVRSSGMILNNYAETTFLKRYGIEYLPIVNMINTVATFLVTGFMATFMARISGARILFYLFIICGLSTTAIRFVIPLGIELIYPLLFMLKSQYELLQALLFWNLANDLFNTRQSKRLFPLLTAGGVVGLIIGSFGTPYLARIFQFDNLLLVYMVTTLAGAAVTMGMGRQFPALMRDVRVKGTGGRPPVSEEVKKVWPILKKSALFRIVLVLTFMPNVVIPIMNFQFNYTVDEFFPTESGMILFFSYFRGVLNIISLFILLFVGRLYGYFGVPLALLFHPVNYMAAFLAFFFRFDIFSAIYARMSTNILRTTINMPATSILIGLFPESYRNMVRPFLRGTVVRAGLLLGSGLILLSVNFFHPRYLSLVALPFILAWVVAPVILKRNYASILKNLISSNLLDIKSLEQENPGKLFRKDRAGEEIIQSFLSARGDDAIWYARLLKSLNVEGLDALILKALGNQDDQTRLKLVEMLSDSPGKETVEALEKLLDPDNPALNVVVLKTITRAAPDQRLVEGVRGLLNDPDPEIRGYAAACVYPVDRLSILSRIDAWLASDDVGERKSGVIAAGETSETDRYAPELEKMVRQGGNEPIVPEILDALAKLGSPGLNMLAMDLVDHDRPEIRHAALSVMVITDESALRKVVFHLGDPDEATRELAKEKIKDADYVSGQVMIESLARPNRNLRENVFELLETLEIKDLDLYRFTFEGLQQCYLCLAKAHALEKLPESKGQRLLYDHLFEKKDLILENLFRILAIHDHDGRMRTVHRGIFSRDLRVRGNSIELFGDVMDRRLFSMFQPLLEGFSLHRSVESGKKFFRIPKFNSLEAELFPAFLNSPDWVETALCLSVLQSLAAGGEREKVAGQEQLISGLRESGNYYIRRSALELYGEIEGVDVGEQMMDNELTISDKILLLRTISIFSGLSVSELGAIAMVTEEVDYPEGETVIREGEPGETVFLIIAGEVAVYKKSERDRELRLDSMEKGDYFGEMALFEEMERSATIRTVADSRFLVLHKREFNELVREYPRIALQICTELSHRLRNLQSQLTQADKMCL